MGLFERLRRVIRRAEPKSEESKALLKLKSEMDSLLGADHYIAKSEYRKNSQKMKA